MTEKISGITIVHKRGDIIENTIGRIGGTLNEYIPFWTPEAIFHNISEDQAESLKDRYRDVNWRGDVKVYLGHNPLFDQLRRQFFELGKRRINFLFRLLPGLPYTAYAWVSSKLARTDFYNPFTETVTVYNPNLAVPTHETGHAEFFDKSSFPGLQALSRFIPGIRTYQEWTASNYAMKHLDPPERQKARKVLEPAVGTYVGADAAILGYLAFPPLAPAIAIVAPFLPLIGLIAGHIHSRLPGTKNIFFDETNVESIPAKTAIDSSLSPALAGAPAS